MFEPELSISAQAAENARQESVKLSELIAKAERKLSTHCGKVAGRIEAHPASAYPLHLRDVDKETEDEIRGEIGSIKGRLEKQNNIIAERKFLVHEQAASIERHAMEGAIAKLDPLLNKAVEKLCEFFDALNAAYGPEDIFERAQQNYGANCREAGIRMSDQGVPVPKFNIAQIRKALEDHWRVAPKKRTRDALEVALGLEEEDLYSPEVEQPEPREFAEAEVSAVVVS